MSLSLFGPVEMALSVNVGNVNDKSGAVAQAQIQLERWYEELQIISSKYDIQLYDLEPNYPEMKLYERDLFDKEVVLDVDNSIGGEVMKDEDQIIHGDIEKSPYLLVKRGQEYVIILQTVVHDPLTYQRNDIIATLGHSSTNWKEGLLIEKGKFMVDCLNEKETSIAG